MTVWGAQDNLQLALGADFRNLNQGILESYDILGSAPASFTTNLPRSDGYDPGMFAELTLPVRSYWTTKIGGRIDYYETSADASQVRANTSLPGVLADPSVLNQNDVLLAFYLTNDINVTDNTTIRIGGGHAQRGPTLRERYADGLFLAIIQSGFTRVIGNPSLRKERAWQIDAGIDYEDDVWRWNVHAFGSWIDDYITYQGNLVNDPLGAVGAGATTVPPTPQEAMSPETEAPITVYWYTADPPSSTVPGPGRCTSTTRTSSC